MIIIRHYLQIISALFENYLTSSHERRPSALLCTADKAALLQEYRIVIIGPAGPPRQAGARPGPRRPQPAPPGPAAGPDWGGLLGLQGLAAAALIMIEGRARSSRSY